MDTPQHCEKPADQPETDAEKHEKAMQQISDDCQDLDPQTMSEEEPSDFSGGGGTTNPTQPGTKPKLP